MVKPHIPNKFPHQNILLQALIPVNCNSHSNMQFLSAISLDEQNINREYAYSSVEEKIQYECQSLGLVPSTISPCLFEHNPTMELLY